MFSPPAYDSQGLKSPIDFDDSTAVPVDAWAVLSPAAAALLEPGVEGFSAFVTFDNDSFAGGTDINEFMFTENNSPTATSDAHYIAALEFAFQMPANSSATLQLQVLVSNCVNCAPTPP